VGKIYKISATPTSQLARIATASGASEPPELTEVFLADQPKGREPWELRSRDDAEILRRIKGDSTLCLRDALLLRQGIKTGADDIFIVGMPGASPTDEFVFTSEGHRIERGVVIPVVRNREIRRWCTRAQEFLIFPYNCEKRRLLSWTELTQRFPHCAEYLETKKERLSKRRSLRGKPWYSLSEDRVESVAESSLRLITAENSLLPATCRPDPAETAVVGSAWLFPKDDAYDLDVLMAYLNSSVVEWYLRQVSSLLEGGYLLLRHTNLKSIPLPRFLADKNSFLHGQLKMLSSQLWRISADFGPRIPHERRIDVQSAEAQIDSLIMQALNLTISQAETLRRSISMSRRTVVGG